MPIRTLAVFFTGLACCFYGLSASAQDNMDGGELVKPFQPDPARGLQVATKLCASCHIVEPGQTGTVQPDVPSFAYIANKAGQDEENIARKMIHPFPPMVDTHLTAEEIKDISAYILSLKKAK